jgi:hypothetical protein
MLVFLSSSVVVACGDSPTSSPDESGSASVSIATLARAAAELDSPPPVSATTASSLPGVATWAIRRPSTGSDVVFEGLDPTERSVVLLAIAQGAPSEDLAVAFWSDPRLATTFDAVRDAAGHDFAGSSGDIEPKAQLIAPASRDQQTALVKCTGMKLVDVKKCAPHACVTTDGKIVSDKGYCYVCADGTLGMGSCG